VAVIGMVSEDYSFNTGALGEIFQVGIAEQMPKTTRAIAQFSAETDQSFGYFGLAIDGNLPTLQPVH
jgi:hypothetical protein